MKHLATTLLHLTSLVSLDLSCTGITNLGLNMFSHPSSASSSHHSLRKLVLSHNHLGQTAGFCLASLLSRFPNISYLYLEDCGLSSYVFQPHTGFGQALKGQFSFSQYSVYHNGAINCIFVSAKTERFVYYALKSIVVIG